MSPTASALIFRPRRRSAPSTAAKRPAPPPRCRIRSSSRLAAGARSHRHRATAGLEWRWRIARLKRCRSGRPDSMRNRRLIQRRCQRGGESAERGSLGARCPAGGIMLPLSLRTAFSHTSACAGRSARSSPRAPARRSSTARCGRKCSIVDDRPEGLRRGALRRGCRLDRRRLRAHRLRGGEQHQQHSGRGERPTQVEVLHPS